MSRERFLRFLDAAENLAAHIHEAPVWIVACLEGGRSTRMPGASSMPIVYPRTGSGQSVGFHLLMSSTKIGEARLTGLRGGTLANSYEQ